MFKNEKTRKRAAVASIIGVMAMSMIGGAIAKYITQIDGTDTSLQVAKWNVTTSSNALTRNAYDEKTVTVDKMAPGTEGKFSVTINPNDTETGIDYVVSVDKLENKPGNLYFIVDGDESNKIHTAEALGTALSGHLDVGAAAVTHSVVWKWDYETTTSPDGTRTTLVANDEQDTQDGQAAKTMTINYSITATQTAPVAK